MTDIKHEALEEALGNLLAVIHGDGGHRALEVGTKQAALEAEKIVAGLFAAPSADKLRIAELEADLAKWKRLKGYADDQVKIERQAYRNLLADHEGRSTPDALKAEGAK